MRAFVVSLGLIAMGVLLVASAGVAQEKPAQEKPVYNYIGVDGCKMCHKMKKTGDQYDKWLNSAHAKAYEVLASDEAKAVATKAGVEGNPQEADQCLSCHVTAHGVDAARLDKKYKVEDGVGCESCHGPGSAYKSKKVMEDQTAAVAAGLIVPTEETCKTCHNEKSPTYKEFDFAKAKAQIAHPVPKAEGK
jgi:hypothetical protein